MKSIRLLTVWVVLAVFICRVSAILPTDALVLSNRLDFELENREDACPEEIEYNSFYSEVVTIGTVDSSASAFEVESERCRGGRVIFAKPENLDAVNAGLQEVVADPEVLENSLYGEFSSSMECYSDEEDVDARKRVDYDYALFARSREVVRIGWDTIMYPDKIYLFIDSQFSRRTSSGKISRDYCAYSARAPSTADIRNESTAPPSVTTTGLPVTVAGGAVAASTTAATGSSTGPAAADGATVPPTTATSMSTTVTDDSPRCFPAAARVHLRDGRTKLMSELSIGDDVLVGVDSYSPVFAFTHRLPAAWSSFVRLETVSGHAVELSHGHYIYANDELVAARDVRPGDVLRLASGVADALVRVMQVRREGLYNPQTLQGDIVVDGLAASTYTETVPPVIAHSVLVLPRRIFAVVAWVRSSLLPCIPL